MTALSIASSAQTVTYDLGGRWTSDRLHYVIDIGKCGEEWCGVRLNDDEICGATVLRLRLPAETNGLAKLTGTLDLRPEVTPYKVSVTFETVGDVKPIRIEMLGDPDEAPSFMTRTIKFYDQLARTGDATCKAEPKTS